MRSINLNLKRLAFLPLLIIICLLVSSFAFAYEREYENTDTGYKAFVDDGADLLTSSDEGQLIDLMSAITEYGNCAFVSVDENYYDTADFAEDYYYDAFGNSAGTIFVIDMDNRELYIYSNGSVYNIITSSRADTITDNVYKMASNEDYAGCAYEAFDEILTLLEGGKISQPMKYICNALLAILCALLICYIIIYTTSRVGKKKTIIDSASASVLYTNPQAAFVRQSRIYSPRSKSDGGGGHSGGGGGGSHGGGGGGHSF